MLEIWNIERISLYFTSYMTEVGRCQRRRRMCSLSHLLYKEGVSFSFNVLFLNSRRVDRSLYFLRYICTNPYTFFIFLPFHPSSFSPHTSTCPFPSFYVWPKHTMQKVGIMIWYKLHSKIWTRKEKKDIHIGGLSI